MLIKKSYKIFSLAIPSLFAISILELTNIATSYTGTSSDKFQLYTILNFLQVIPAFLFAYISDKHFRKKTLLISQLFGFLGILILFLFGVKFWVLITLAITFNPIPVARAALLDNFPHSSSLKIVAFTFLAQYCPWIFYDQIASLPIKNLHGYILALLFANLILTAIFFKDRTDTIHTNPQNTQARRTPGNNFISDLREIYRQIKKRKQHRSNPTQHHLLSSIFGNLTHLTMKPFLGAGIISKINKRMFYTVIAFMFAEISLYLVWIFLQHSENKFIWFDYTNLGIFIGVACALFYSVLPHMTLITLFYAVGLCMYLVLFTIQITGVLNCESCLLNTFSHYSIIVGMYMIFVTEAIIKMFGPLNKAIGAAVTELTSAIGMVISATIFLLTLPNTTAIICLIIPLFFGAVYFQKGAEKAPIVSKELEKQVTNAPSNDKIDRH